MRPKSLLLLVLALGCGLIASVGISQVMDRKPAQVVVEGETQDVLVVLQDVPYGTTLTAEVLKLEKWPKDRVPAGALADAQKAVGRRARGKLFKGEPVLEPKLLTDGTAVGASQQIPSGFRVVSVKVDASTTGGSLVLPGDRVDVLVNVRANTGAGIMESSSKTILQDVKVFAVDQTYNVEAIEEQDSVISAKTVSLLVTPPQAEKIALAEELGKIRLSIRSPEDDSEVHSGGADLSSLFGGADKADRDEEQGSSGGGQDGKGFVDWLTSRKAPANTETETATGAADAGWTMILLIGAEPREVRFDGVSPLPAVSSSGGTGGSMGPTAEALQQEIGGSGLGPRPIDGLPDPLSDPAAPAI